MQRCQIKKHQLLISSLLFPSYFYHTCFSYALLLPLFKTSPNMPTAKYFSRYPAFPKDLPVMDLPRISLARLATDDDAESAQLFRACKETGFFLLDLRGTGEGEIMLKDAEATFDLSEKVFDTDQAELMKHAFTIPGGVFGCVHLGFFCQAHPIYALRRIWRRLQSVIKQSIGTKASAQRRWMTALPTPSSFTSSHRTTRSV